MRRTLSADILLSSEYRKLSGCAQSLYIFILMSADEYGFIENIYKFICANGYKLEDLRPLVAAGYIIIFPNDTILVADWFVHSGKLIALAKNRETEYSYITLDENSRFIESEKLTHLRKSAGKKRLFVPPTLEEVVAYAKERNSTVDPYEFFKYFDTPNENGEKWVDANGKRVENWKGKFVTWEKFRGVKKSNGRNNSAASQQVPARNPKWNIRYDVDGRRDEES